MVTVHTISLFPDAIESYFAKGIFKRAQESSFFRLNAINLRDYAEDKHHKVDDMPFGGGHGMVMKVDVLSRALRDIDDFESYHVIYPCPQGTLFTQEMSTEWAQTVSDGLATETGSHSSLKKGLIFIVGYYEGIDERFFHLFDVKRVSIGHFVLSSGELPAMMMIEALVRQLPGVLGHQDSFENDSLISGFLEEPHYTHPREFEGLVVPEVLLSGHHKNIAEWKQSQRLEKTLFKNPSLLAKQTLTDSDKQRLSAHIDRENEKERES